jgi:hypothetical protein
MTTSAISIAGANAGDNHGMSTIQLPSTARANLLTASNEIVEAVATVLDAEFDTVSSVQDIKDALIGLLQE